MKTTTLLSTITVHRSYRILSIKVKSSLVVLCLVTALFPLPSSSQPLAKGQSKFLGSSMRTPRSDFSTYWNQVTADDAGKWGSVELTQGVYSWSALDNIYNYAVGHYYPYKHHNLIWGQQQPSWITSITDTVVLSAKVQEWIDTVAQRYPSTSFVDVVNEPFHAPPPYMNALGGSGTTGWDWVITAFRWARQDFFPGVKLILNEYNILQDNNVTTNFINLIDTLKVRRLIDAIGIQGHYFEFKSAAGLTPVYSYPVSTLKYNLDRLAATGLPIYISEFDINEPDDGVQLANYKTYFPLFWENPGVKGITLWGYVQGDIWQMNAYLVRIDGSERPALQWLRIYVATPAVVSPVGLTDQPRDVTLQWRRSVPATSYRVQVATDSLFAAVVADTTVSDTLVHLNPLSAFTSFYWHVSAVDSMGASANSIAAKFTTGNQVLAVERPNEVPQRFGLSQNYPNPFNPTTELRYDIPERSFVQIAVYDLLGRAVSTLVNEVQNAGHYRISFSAANLPSGVYFYELKAGDNRIVRKMVLLK
jgi:endo-1,4-beta-xylanase